MSESEPERIVRDLALFHLPGDSLDQVWLRELIRDAYVWSAANCQIRPPERQRS